MNIINRLLWLVSHVSILLIQVKALLIESVFDYNFTDSKANKLFSKVSTSLNVTLKGVPVRNFLLDVTAL